MDGRGGSPEHGSGGSSPANLVPKEGDSVAGGFGDLEQRSSSPESGTPRQHNDWPRGTPGHAEGRLFAWLNVDQTETDLLRATLGVTLAAALAPFFAGGVQSLSDQVELVIRGVLGPPPAAKAVLVAIAHRRQLGQSRPHPVLEFELSGSSSSFRDSDDSTMDDEEPELVPPPLGKMMYHTLVVAISATMSSELMASLRTDTNDFTLLAALSATLLWSTTVMAGLLGFPTVASEASTWGRLPQVYALHLGMDRRLTDPQYPPLTGASLLSFGSVVIGLFNKVPMRTHIILDGVQVMLLWAWPACGRLDAWPALGRLCSRLASGPTHDCVAIACSLQWLLTALPHLVANVFGESFVESIPPHFFLHLAL